MPAQSYFEKAIAALQTVLETQRDAISQAADLLTEAITTDRCIFSFGASHSFILTEEMVYRTGGLMLVNPIYPHGMNLSVRPLTLTSQIERIAGLGARVIETSPAKAGDVLILASTSGRNAVVIDMALAARELGIKTVGITSAAYSAGVNSRHPSGMKLSELCDILIDNGAPYGDAAVDIEGFKQRTGPLSTVTGCAIVNAIVVEVVESLVLKGIVPPVYMSANLDGGEAHNEPLLAENRHRIFYL
jgi:uncharacterized phosphosugar-binding protein